MGGQTWSFITNQCQPCQCNWIPKGSDGQIVQRSDHKWNSALHGEA